MKKFLLSALALVAVAALAITGTIAYLQFEDEDVNVMTLGNVKIEQLEYERVVDEDGTFVTGTIDEQTSYVLKEFTQDKPLLPIVGDPSLPGNDPGYAGYDDTVVRMTQVNSYGSMQVFAGKNAQDKFVTVENTGKSDAYVRTVIAMEIGSLSVSRFDKVIGTSSFMTEQGVWEVTDIGPVVIDGNNYFVVEYLYNGAKSLGGVHENGVLPAGDTTYPSLAQVYMTAAATNEDCENIDGNKNGTYDILVLSQAVQAKGFDDAKTALNTAFADLTTDNGIALAAEWFGGVIAEHSVDTWDGTADTTWYNENDTEFIITTAEQLAGLAELVDDGNTFAGKTVKLGKDLDLANVVFEPIGSYRNDKAFKGAFDGQGHKIKNLSQNTWALNNGYEYGDLGLGLFGKVQNAKIKNLVMDGASISGESAICGIVAATAYGDCIFENITVSNSEAADYQYYAGGIVGWASGNHQYINCNVDATTTIAAQWGDFDNSTGGIIGGAGGSAEILLKDCNVACRIDAYNDVTSSYQWYAYRRCGMLIGNPGNTKVVDGTTYAAAPQLTCENVTVVYGDWANYTYCEFAGTSWPYVRVQAGVSNSAYSNPRYGHPTDANGNTVVDDNHVHNDGEDHFIECTFDQLYGGGQGVYGTATHDGVNVIYNNK